MQQEKERSAIKKGHYPEPGISLVLACYNEAEIFKDSSKKIEEFMESQGYSYELVFVEDKSVDNTVELIREFASNHKKVKTIFHEHNMGRGRTVADGIRAAKGEIVGFIDIDLEVPISQIAPLVNEIRGGADAAIGKRVYFTGIRTIHRHILSRAYSLLSRVMLNHDFSDTEAGCKFFKREKILSFLSQIKENHWFWDTEIVLRPYFAGLKVKEVPVLFIKNRNASSTVKIFSDAAYYLKMLWKYAPEFQELSRKML
ncbi:MAG: glycosyltransferase [Candidatus Diapherotrites archaeon]